MQGYDQEICRTRFFVGLRIEVDAPGTLAAIRPWMTARLWQFINNETKRYRAMHY